MRRMKQALDRPDAIKKARAVIRVAEESVQNLTKKMSWLNESHTQIVTNKTDHFTGHTHTPACKHIFPDALCRLWVTVYSLSLSAWDKK